MPPRSPRPADDQAPFAPLERLAAAVEAVSALPVVDSAKQLAKARRCLVDLLAERRWLDRHCKGQPPLPVHPNGFFVLREAPRYSIFAGQFPRRHRTAIHDHKTWGLIGTWSGEEIDQRFRIVEHADDGRVRFARTHGTVNGPGDVSVLIPRVDEIHMVGNVRARPAYSVHVYGYGTERRVGPSTWYSSPGADGWARVLPPLPG